MLTQVPETQSDDGAVAGQETPRLTLGGWEAVADKEWPGLEINTNSDCCYTRHKNRIRIRTSEKMLVLCPTTHTLFSTRISEPFLPNLVPNVNRTVIDCTCTCTRPPVYSCNNEIYLSCTCTRPVSYTHLTLPTKA